LVDPDLVDFSEHRPGGGPQPPKGDLESGGTSSASDGPAGSAGPG
jgi:hypothetical protein